MLLLNICKILPTALLKNCFPDCIQRARRELPSSPGPFDSEPDEFRRHLERVLASPVKIPPPLYSPGRYSVFS